MFYREELHAYNWWIGNDADVGVELAFLCDQVENVIVSASIVTLTKR